MDERDYFIESLVVRLEALEKAQTSLKEKSPEDAALVRRIAHTLRGSGTTFGFSEITHDAAALEESVEEELFIRLENLIATIRKVTLDIQKERPASISWKGYAPSMEMKTILLVDDDPDIIRIASMALEKLGGFKVIPASEGKEAIESAKRYLPDIILMDYMMPDLNGQDILEILRADEQTRTISVVFFTAKSGDSDIKRLLSLGAKGVIVKPFDPMKLSEDVKRLLGF